MNITLDYTAFDMHLPIKMRYSMLNSFVTFILHTHTHNLLRTYILFCVIYYK